MQKVPKIVMKRTERSLEQPHVLTSDLENVCVEVGVQKHAEVSSY